MKEFWNNKEHNLKQYKTCKCSFDMRLEAKEDTKGDITYFYICSYVKCGVIEEVK